ncbi:MAG: ABC transporter substrate-binding protein [Deltaproteobacteria bacterium]|jgi:polar amino acid transport system substrate-binding protein|nr:ABC transporter substrate-binding protein [Deltaproteobacteria bacterium]
MKTLSLFVLLVLALTSSSLFADISGKTFVNGFGASFPPFAYINSAGQPTGFDIEAINWIAEKLGFKVTHQEQPWDSIVTNLLNKRIDMVASGLSVTPSRAAQIAFSKPYWSVDQVVLVRKDSTLTVEQILTGGYTIGVQKDTSETKSMEESNGLNGRRYTLSSYASAALAASDVVNGRIVAAVLNDASTAEVVKHLAVMPIGQAGIPSEQFAYGVNKDNPELLEALNQGLDLLMADPFWEYLNEKYKPGASK